jgi:hypothetical protein
LRSNSVTTTDTTRVKHKTDTLKVYKHLNTIQTVATK